MRAIAIDANEHGGLGSLLDEMHQLRARVFAGRLGWQVKIERSREQDKYDALGTTYIVALMDRDDVTGSACLLPTFGPTMLPRTFPQLLAGGKLRGKPTMIKSSRFCVDTRGEGREGHFLHEATLTMFAGIIEGSMSNGFDEIATSTDLRFERILHRARWPMTRLGGMEVETINIDGSLPADRTSFDQVCPPGYCPDLRGLTRAAARAPTLLS